MEDRASNKRIFGIGCGLLLVIVLLLAGGLYYLIQSRHIPPTVLGKQIDTQAAQRPVATVNPVVASTFTPEPPTATASPTPPPTRTPTPKPTSTATATPSPTSTPTPKPTNTPKPTPTVDLKKLQAKLEPEIRKTYDAYWKARTKAYHDLDPKVLQPVTGDPLYTKEEMAIEKMKRDGEARQLKFDHKIKVELVAPDRAYVIDTLTEDSVGLDAKTKKPVWKMNPRTYTVRFELRKTDGKWKIIDVVRNS